MTNALHPLTFLAFPGEVLRPLGEADLPALQRMVNDPEVRPYVTTMFPEHEANEREWITNLAKNRQHNIVLGIEVMHDGAPTLVGTMGLHRINWRDRTAATGTMIGDARYQNRGIGTAAKMALLRYAFFELNLRQVYSEIIAFNGRSARYAAKCGYRQYGRVPQDCYRDGRYYDRLLFRVTRPWFTKCWNEWCTQHPHESIDEMVARHARMNRE